LGSSRQESFDHAFGTRSSRQVPQLAMGASLRKNHADLGKTSASGMQAQPFGPVDQMGPAAPGLEPTASMLSAEGVPEVSLLAQACAGSLCRVC
jgi:hypothetical protein